MAQCNNCGAELSNETTNCMVCGSTDINNSYSPELEYEELEEPKFTSGITIWLILMCIGAIRDIMSGYEILDYTEFLPNASLLAYTLMFLSALRLVGIVILFMRKRIGFYMMAASVLLLAIVMAVSAESYFSFIAFVPLYILYRLLNREREGESMSLWDSMD